MPLHIEHQKIEPQVSDNKGRERNRYAPVRNNRRNSVEKNKHHVSEKLHRSTSFFEESQRTSRTEEEERTVNEKRYGERGEREEETYPRQARQSGEKKREDWA